MTEGTQRADTLTVIGNATAPFIYWDGVAAMGINNGAIELELCSRTMIPTPPSHETRVEIIITAHLRCSPAAARLLREAIDKVLNMQNQAQQQPVATPGRLN